jgi:hypothetical protein
MLYSLVFDQCTFFWDMNCTSPTVLEIKTSRKASWFVVLLSW